MALRAPLPASKPLRGSCRAVWAWGDAGVGWGKRWCGDRKPDAGRVSGRGELRGGTRTAQPAFSRCISLLHTQLLRGKTGGEHMVKHPTRESRSHPFPTPPTAPATCKFPELIDYRVQISILLNYNLVLMHIFRVFLFHICSSFQSAHCARNGAG